MDLDEVVSLILEKLTNANVYSELGRDAMKKSILAGLRRAYQKHLYEAQKQLREEERSGAIPDTKKYEKAYAQVEDMVLAYATQLAAIDKTEV